MAQSIKITSPVNGATVQGKVAIKVSTTAVGTVIYYVDGTRVYSDSSSPFTYTWDTTKVKNGTHTFKVTSGNGKVSSSVKVNVLNSILTSKFTYKEI